MTKLLILGNVWPEPNSSAAGSRMLQLMDTFLSEDWQITFASPAAESEHRFEFEKLGVIKANIEINSQSFDTFVSELKPDIVLFDRFIMEEQFGWRVAQYCPEALRLLETVDLHCLREARQHALKQQREFTRTDLFNDIAKREIASILRCDLSLLISSYEVTLLTDYFKVDKNLLLWLPFMIEPVTDRLQQSLPPFEQRQNFITIGNFRHPPNWDAVLFLKQTIWPLIHNKLPQTEMHIYGSYPPPKAIQLHKPEQGFYIKGWAESAEEVIKNARVCLAPLRFGAGIKGKLFDAMQYGTPSITTDIGAESMHGNLNWNGFIKNSPENFSEAAIKLYNDKNLWLTKQNNGFKLINTLYNKNTHRASLLEKLQVIKIGLKEHRLNNFYGSMLQHHTLKSTQYMAQWIEAKNRLNQD